ncbi:MAG TPA: hypothetical protein VGR71_18360, partial [Nitrospira sp.]|nr:hypothetical protein [Nitrospira sp.]
MTRAVEKYLDLQALASWLRPLFAAQESKLPAHVAVALGHRYPGLLEFVNTQLAVARSEKPSRCQGLLNWGQNHVLSQAKKEGWLDRVVRQAHQHPRYVRIVDYAPVWSEFRSANPTSPYPSFRQWRSDTESFVRTSRKSELATSVQ